MTLSQVFGQWRIAAVDNPQVLWLTSYDIERVFAQVPLYYVAPARRVLVPTCGGSRRPPGSRR